MPVNRLGDLERSVMNVLWERGEPLTARDVGRALADDRDLAHTTVMTVLDRLAKKGLLRRQRHGRAWRYRPAASREAYVAELMLGALEETGDRDAALVRFARSVTGEEAQVLRGALEEMGAEVPAELGGDIGREPAADEHGTAPDGRGTRSGG